MRYCLPLIAGALLVLSVPALAQDGPGGQEPGTRGEDSSKGADDGRNVFTDALSAVMTAPTWNFGVSIFGGYNQTNAKNTTATGTIGSFVRSGSTAGVTTRLMTSKSFRRVDLGLGGGTSSTYFRSTGRVITTFSGQTSQNFSVGRQSSLSFGEAVYYAPFYTLNQYPGLQTFAGTQLTTPTQPGFDAGIGELSQTRYTLQGRFNHPITDRTAFSMQYSGDAATVGSGLPRSLFQQAGFRFNHNRSAGFGYYAGYTRMWASFQGAFASPVFNNIDVGVNLRKALSISRRTTLSFSTGTTMWRSINGQGDGSSGASGSGGDPGAGDGTSTQPSSSTTSPSTTTSRNQTQFQIVGYAALNHDIGRTWHARVAYNRNWQIVAGTVSAAMGDTLSAGLSGNVGRKATAGTTLSYLMLGRQAVAGSASDRHAMVSNVFLSFVMKSSVSGFVQASHYRQKFDFSQTGLNLPSQFNRSSVRAGLTISFRSR